MTQFAYFTGKKPKFRNYEFVLLSEHHTKSYVGAALTESEVNKTWVINDPCTEPVDNMLNDAMESFQVTGTIADTELHELIASYVGCGESVTFIYGVYDESIPVYSDPETFIEAVTDALSEGLPEICAKYVAQRKTH